MQIKSLQKIFVILVFTSGILMSNSVIASVLTIDNFTHAQSVIDRGNTAGSASAAISELAGTDLSHASRTFVAEATANGRYSSSTEISTSSKSNSFAVDNSIFSSGIASITWNFDPIDFTKYGTGMLLEVISVNQSVNAEIVVNGIASSGIKAFSSVDNFLVSFNDFSNSSVFASVNSLSLNFSGPVGWDAEFRLLMDNTPASSFSTTTAVPLPSAYFLMSSALLGLIGISRRKLVI
ncbi:MAG: hypothetical protein PHR94_07390 [Methylomonas lenta]|nr:hypothetical protein [Methylomonas lenta]